ncbi:alpha-crystallin [Mycobacterium kansasii]|uniref:Alpha-crystallin n=1 Tax=Mycobacterium kansasii TaxID=1768 RepID=A0A1V3W8Q8_MYCKA|nr:alpha-crystallin [Mycobacterium kansasii]
MPLEDELKDGRYEVRAEFRVSTRQRTSTSPCTTGADHQGRTNREERFDGRSEFSYGSFVRTVALPRRRRRQHRGTYDKGILTVSVAVSDAKPAERRIPIRRAN